MKNVGIWTDDHYAVILIENNKRHFKYEVFLERDSSLFPKVPFKKNKAANPEWESNRPRPPENYLKKFYETILAIVGRTDTVHLCGPGFRKHALQRDLIARNDSEMKKISIHCSQGLNRNGIINDLLDHIEESKKDTSLTNPISWGNYELLRRDIQSGIQ